MLSALKSNGMNSHSPHRVFVVDDHPFVREGLAALIGRQADLAVCGEAASPAEAIAGIERTRPDLVLVDLSLGDESGLELIKRIQLIAQPPQVLVISMHDELYYAERALRAGARGYVMKRETSGKLIEGIRQVLAGSLYVSAPVSARLAEQFVGHRAGRAESPISRLSDRELEVFQLIGRGMENREISETLHVSLKTVQAHCANIKDKLALPNGTALIREAVRWLEAENRA